MNDTAISLPVPAVSLDQERLQALENQFTEELRPQGVVEQVLVQQAAFAAALLEQSSAWEQNIARELQESLINPWQLSPQPQSGELTEICQRILSSDSLSKATGYTQKHFRRLAKSLSELDRLQRRKQRRSWPENHHTEQECVDRMRRRFESPDWRCPSCQQQAGDWLPSRQVWECRHCHRQIGVRVGTPLENSPLPLQIWAYAYQLLRWDPEIPTRQLASRLQLNRLETVRRLRTILTPVLEDPDALGGLVT